MKNKTTIILLSILLIGLAAYFMLQKKTNHAAGLEPQFAIENMEVVERITIQEKDRTEIRLEKQSDYWRLNDSLRAQQEQVELLLSTLHNMEMKFVPPRAALPGIREDLERNGVQINVYNRSRQSIKSFLMGGVTSDERGTYVLLEGDDYPYVVHLPNWEGSLRPRFVKPFNEWRDRYFLRLNPDHIQSITIDYPLQQEHSFRLFREEEKWRVQDHIGESKSNINLSLVQAYLQEFKRLGAEAYINDQTLIRQYPKRIPHALVKIQLEDKERTLPVYAIQYADGTIDQERYHIYSSNKELVLVQRRILGKILKPLSYFEAQ